MGLLLVALEINTKDILNGTLMAKERSTSHLQALIHIRLKSTLVNLSKGDGFSMIDGIHQLNVFLELSICCHTSSFYVCRITGQLHYPDGQFPLCVVVTTQRKWVVI